ncbi:MAG TPA: hypothetical protein PJ982_03905, partial [Lacipirellulaceae bacterium]|nr:hypothetical protein [Lacipirellulaceae bacterium]
MRCCTRKVLVTFGTLALAFALSPARAAAQSPCAASHKGLYYNNDFSYLSDPAADIVCLGDALKLLPVADGAWGTLDLGGQLRSRYHHEVGMGQDLAGPG